MTDSSAESRPAAAPATSDRVPLIQKFGYGLGSIHDMWGHWLYGALVFLVFNVNLGMSPKWIGWALLCKLAFEMVWDSVFGWWSDNTRTRFGRRRPFILVGAVLSGFALPLLFSARSGWTDVQYFFFLVGTLAIFVPIMSCFYMPFQSLGSEMTSSYHERTSIGAVRSAIQKFPEVAMFAAGAFATSGVWVSATWRDVPERFSRLAGATFHWFGDVFASLFGADWTRFGSLLKTIFGWTPPPDGVKANALLGTQVYTVMLGAIMVVAGVVIFLLTREPFYEKLVVARKQGKVSILETLGQTLVCQPFRVNLSMAFAYGLGTSMVGALGWYATVYYVCRGNVGVGAGWNTWMGLSGMLLGLCGIPFYAFIARRVGKKHCMMVVQLSAIAVFFSTWWLYTPSIQWLQVFASGFIAFTSAGFWVMYGSMTADVIDADELDTGKRREGSFAACGSWIMKAGQALGNLGSGWILAATGFDQALGEHQKPDAIFAIRFFLAAIPIAGLIVSFILLTRFPLTEKRMGEIRGQLEARRGTV